MQPAAEHVERQAPRDDWSPPPSPEPAYRPEPAYQPEPVARPEPPAFVATGGESAPAPANTDERGPT